MNLKDLFKKRRSIRKYQDKAVSLETIQDLIKDSILAPSAGNEQSWEFIIVNDREMINRISTECKQNMLKRFAENPNDHAKKYEKMLSNEAFNIFYHAPTLVFILGDASIKNLDVDCSLAASYFMLSAADKGLGTCWVNFGREMRSPELLKELGIKEYHRIVAPIALGYPIVIPEVPRRNKPRLLKVIV